MTENDRCAACARGPCAQHLTQAQLTNRSPAVARAVAAVDPARLRIRPCEIVLCVLCGDSNRNIAERLGISVSTVKYHLRRLVAENPLRTANDL